MRYFIVSVENDSVLIDGKEQPISVEHLQAALDYWGTGYKVSEDSPLLTGDQVIALIEHFPGLNAAVGAAVTAEYRQTGRFVHAVKASLNLEPVTMWRRKGGGSSIPAHYHVAKYVDEVLVRECRECGRDLQHDSHIRGGL